MNEWIENDPPSINQIEKWQADGKIVEIKPDGAFRVGVPVGVNWFRPVKYERRETKKC